MSQNRAAMQIFLPIAEVSVNALTLIGLGTIVGLMSGLFGVGGIPRDPARLRAHVAV